MELIAFSVHWRSRVAMAVMASLFVLSSCQSQKTADPAAQVAELRTVSETFNRSPEGKAAADVVQFYDSTVVVMSPQGGGLVEGLDANRVAWERFFSGGNPVHTMTTDTVVVAASGDLGYTRGQWTVGVDIPMGRAEASGDYLAVWQRRGGSWRIVALTAYPFQSGRAAP